MVRRSAVGVPVSPGKFMRLPPTHIRVWFFSSFSGLYRHWKFTYVTSFLWSAGMSAFLMKMIVFVPLTRPGIPCASLPNSFPHEWSHVAPFLDLL